MSDVAVSNGRQFSEAVRLVTDVGDARLSSRARQLTALRGHLEKWTARAKRDAHGLEQLATKDVGADLAVPALDKRSRAGLAKLSRSQVQNAKRVRATIQSQIAYLESNRSTVAMLAAIGVTGEVERRRAKEVDRANTALRAALARLVEAIDDGLDILLVIAAHFDPENDVAGRSLAEVEAAYPGAAE